MDSYPSLTKSLPGLQRNPLKFEYLYKKAAVCRLFLCSKKKDLLLKQFYRKINAELGYRLMVGQRILIPSVLVRVQVAQPVNNQPSIWAVYFWSVGQDIIFGVIRKKSHIIGTFNINGGIEGARTLDLLRDRQTL